MKTADDPIGTSINGSGHPSTDAPSLPHSREGALAWIRQALVEPLHAVIPLAKLVIEDAKERPDDFRGDLQKMLQAAEGLLDFVQTALDQALFQEGDFAQVLQHARHELSNRLNKVSGFCQLAIFREEHEFFGAYLADLKRILELCRECERRLLQFRHAAPAATTSGPRMLPPTAAPLAPAPHAWQQTEPGDLLIVDDDPEGRKILRRLLEPKKHRIHEAVDGIEALALIKEQTFDAVLLDIEMPRMNGFQFLQELRQSDALAPTPVIVVSGHEDIDSWVRCLEMGAADYLSKPVDNMLLQARVNSCLQRRRFQRRQLEQFFPSEIARQLLVMPHLLREGQEMDVTILFCDVRGFSRISEKLGPNKMVQWLSEVMEMLSASVLDFQGTLVDFVGDELMAMWGAPTPQKDHAELACRAALDIVTRLPELSESWKPKIRAETEVGIGINTGLARVGNIGTRKKFKYGPLGNTVNLASRVQGATKYLKSRLLITEETRRRLDDSFYVRRLAKIRAVNIKKPIDLFEVMPAGQPDWLHLKQDYEAALDLYEAKQVRRAAERLSALVNKYGARGPELALMSRAIESLVEADKWKKVWDLPGK